MRGFCGWFSSDLNQCSPADIVLSMGEQGSDTRYAHKESWAVIMASEVHNNGFYAAESGMAIVTGTPVSGCEKLAALFARHGVAKACLLSYQESGLGFLQNLEGAFSLVLYLKNESKYLLVRDRTGINQLYYAVGNRSIGFSTRLSSLYKNKSLKLEVDNQSVYEYLYHQVIPSPNTIYKDLYSLDPGSYVEIKGAARQVGQYWRVKYTQEHTRLNLQDLESEFIDVLYRSVRAEASTEENMGCFLSGGTDSSTLAGVLSEISQEPVQTYSIGFDQDGFDEMSFARLASSHFGTVHHEYYVTPDDIIDLVPQIAEAYGQPFGNSSVVPTYYCAKMAEADGVTKLLGGDGGDELFGGNKRYGIQLLFSYYELLPLRLRRQILEPLSRQSSIFDRLGLIRKAKRYIEQACIPMPDRLHTYGYFDFIGIENMLTPGFMEEINPEQTMQTLRDYYSEIEATHIINKMAALDLKVTLADNDLLKVTDMCDLAGVQVGYPFLHQEMIDFSSRLPANMKVHRLKIRYFFKKALRDFLPKEILQKQKHGFGLPFGDWLVAHDGLRDMAFDSLEALKKRQIVRSDFIDELKSSRLADHANYYGGLIWLLMILEMSLQRNHDR